MDVTIAAHDLYPDPGAGGTGRYVYETATRLTDRGHDVAVVTRRRGDVPDQETIDGVEVRRYDLSIAGCTWTDVARQLPDARRTVAAHCAAAHDGATPDVVSFQGPVTAALVDRTVAASVPRVTTFHSPWPVEYRIKTRKEDGAGRRRLDASVRRRLNVSLRRRVEAAVLARSDHVITLSEYMARKLAQVYGPDAPCSVVPGGVDGERFAPDAPPDGRLATNGLAILTVRRLSERMGHDLLLRAFGRVQREHPDAHLYVAGDGPLRERLRRTAERLKIAAHVTFLGYVTDQTLPRVYASADVFVLPTASLEGFGLATLEAMAAGTPVVATPVGGTVEVLSPLRAGDSLPADPLVDGVDVRALKRGLSKWLSLSPRARERAGRRCAAYVRERYAWERTVDGLLAVYEECIGERRRASPVGVR